MFSEKEMSKAIDWLFELFEPDDYEGYDEEEIGYAGGLCMPEVCIALRGAMQTVYQYSIDGGYDKSFDYRKCDSEQGIYPAQTDKREHLCDGFGENGCQDKGHNKGYQKTCNNRKSWVDMEHSANGSTIFNREHHSENYAQQTEQLRHKTASPATYNRPHQGNKG